jgi:transcriptional regulator with XRE-family HTH domain
MTFFGTNIKKIRQIKGLSQNSFAELLELNRGVISSYEDGRAEPKIETVLRIAEYFKIPMNDLLSKALTVNQLANFSDFETIVPQISKNEEKKEILQNGQTVNLDLQKIFAKFDCIYEVDDLFAKQSIFAKGSILFLQKANHETTPKSFFLIIKDKKVFYTDTIDLKNNCYLIVGSLFVNSIPTLESILSRLDRLEGLVGKLDD